MGEQKLDKEWLDRELDQLVRLQREGAFGPMLDTGNFAPLSAFATFLGDLLLAEQEMIADALKGPVH